MTQPFCKFYGSARGCHYGQYCKYNHSNPTFVPICRYFVNLGACAYGSECRFRHATYVYANQHGTCSWPSATQTKHQRRNQNIKKSKNKMTKHSLLIHGYVRGIGTNKTVPIEMLNLCKRYCNSLIPGLLKSMKKGRAINIIKEYLCRYFCDVESIEYIQSCKIAHEIIIRYSSDSKNIVPLCDMFLNEQVKLPMLREKMEFSIEFFKYYDRKRRLWEEEDAKSHLAETITESDLLKQHIKQAFFSMGLENPNPIIVYILQDDCKNMTDRLDELIWVIFSSSEQIKKEYLMKIQSLCDVSVDSKSE